MPGISVLGRVPVNRGDILPTSGSLLPVTAGLQVWLRADMGTTLNEITISFPNDFDNAAWAKSGTSVTPDATTDPFGGGLADSLVEGGAVGVHLIAQGFGGSFVASLPQTVSIYAKAGSRTWIFFGSPDASSGRFVNLLTGTFGATNGTVNSSSIVSAGNGWWLITLSVTNASGQIIVYLATADNVVNYAGNGTGNVYLYGAAVSQPKVSTWADQSGNAHNLVQATTAKQPLLVQNAINGHPAVAGDGIDDTMKATFALVQPEYVFIVAKFNKAFVATDDLFDGNTGNSMRIFRDAGPVIGQYAGAGPLTAADTTLTSWHYLTGFFNGAAATARQDGSTIIAVGNAGASNGGGLTLFTFGDAVSNPANASIAEVLVYSTILSTADREQVEAYLAQRYGIPSFVGPTSLPGCVLWLRADLGLTLNNPSVLAENNFDDAVWVKTRSSVTADATMDPFGGSLADSLIEDNSNNSHLITQTPGNVVSTLPVTYSVYAKAGARSWLLMSDTVASLAYFNLGAGAIGTTASCTATITSAGNGWYRCTITVTAAGAPAWNILLASADGVFIYAGDGTSNIYLYGASMSQPTVSGWADQSGLANDMLQATKAKQPLWSPSAVNGQPTVHFDGVNDFLTTAFITLPVPYCVFVVHKMTPQAPNNFSVWFAGATNDALFEDTTPRTYLSVTVPISVSYVAANGAFASVNCIIDNAASSIRSNALELVSGNVGNLTGTGAFTLAATDTGGLNGNTEMAEIFVYNRHLTGPEIAQLEAYQKARYALP